MTDIVQIQESEYDAILRQAVAVIDKTRSMVATTVCSAIGTAHWEIGKLLHDKKLESKHGSGVVNRLSFDLKQRYPQMGVSPRNLWDMKKFYERFCDSEPKLRQAVAVLPWGHTLTLMRKFGDDNNTILYYAQEITSKGWNRELLFSAISLQMHKKKKESSDNNFEQTLPATQAMFANEVFRSGYNLGFLGVKDPILETELETRLVEKVKQFLLELGKGFTYIGNQHVLEYNGKRSKVDMLFSHRGLHCLVAIDLLCCAQHNQFLCCVVNYVVLMGQTLDNKASWSQEHNIIFDYYMLSRKAIRSLSFFHFTVFSLPTSVSQPRSAFTFISMLTSA